MKRTLSYLKPYKKTVAAGLVVKFIGSIAELFLPLILKYVIDDVAPRKNLTEVILYGLAMLGFALVALFGNIIANRFSVKAAAKMTHDIRLDLFSKTSNLKCRQVDGVSTPSLVSRLTSDTYHVNQMTARCLRMGVRAPILLVGGLILAAVMDWQLALVLACAVPFVVAAVFFISKKIIPCYFDIQRGGDAMVRSAQENITGVRVVKALSKEEAERAKFDRVSDNLAAKEFKANKVMLLTNPLATLMLDLGLVAVIIVAALRSADSGTMLAFLSYVTIILNAMLGLSKIFVVLSRGVASAGRIEEVLSLDCEEKTAEYPAGKENFKIEFRGVSFSYNGVENNLEDINFTLKSGQSLGIIGATGSGKSTVINLLMRFYDVGSGAVYVDGRDVRSIPAEELRLKFGAAFQSDFLMAASVRENIDYYRGLTDEAIEKAVACAQAKEFIDGLSGGLSYDLAQKAADLSGGQKQRLLIARALAGDPEILVLDDSSSALDYATDAALRKAVAENYANSTRITVAQRVSSVMNCDLILVLDDGRVAGKGTHGELLKSCEEYRAIHAAQMGERV